MNYVYSSGVKVYNHPLIYVLNWIVTQTGKQTTVDNWCEIVCCTATRFFSFSLSPTLEELKVKHKAKAEQLNAAIRSSMTLLMILKF